MAGLRSIYNPRQTAYDDVYGYEGSYEDYPNTGVNGGNDGQVQERDAGPARTRRPSGGQFRNGWNFEGHENVGSNLRTPKYMLSNYLIENNVDPNSDWSQGAYDYLNGLGVQGLQRNGGRRLSFGDEFVDSDSTRGWGDQFFWGSNPGSDRGPGGMPGSSNPMFAPSGIMTGGESGAGGGTGGASGGLDPALEQGILSILRAGWAPDKNQLAKRYESARETIDRGRKSQMNNLGAQLAERGLLGQGPEKTGLENIESNLAGQFSTALRDATLEEDKIASDRYMSALNAGLGMGANDINRKKVMGELAVAQLNQNRMWNQFLAEFGLDRERVMHDMEMGNIDRYTALIEMFMRYGQSTSNGQVAG